ncbi:MAG: carbohydrate ABC transporter substrate-binding protein [Deltaproteobacteria bacterium]|nr:carbohydrate ABC transporter substrate-binding protein [Deltaproteobacteria bacterium]
MKVKSFCSALLFIVGLGLLLSSCKKQSTEISESEVKDTPTTETAEAKEAPAAAAKLILTDEKPTGTLEIYSWWAGDEGPALEALIDLYKKQNPEVKVVNATVTGGSGVNARAVLKTRMLGGDPPDSFQIHAGQELIGTWVAAERMIDLTPLYEAEGWKEKFPQDMLKLLGTKDGIWSVPVNIHRSNVMWYIPKNLKKWGVEVPKTWDDFFKIAKKLKKKGITPLALGENWTVNHLWESVALGVLGPEKWEQLWDGSLSFSSPEAINVWKVFSQILEYVNKDHDSLSWQQATDRMVKGKAAFNIMGDWAAGYMSTTLKLEPGKGYGWSPSPGSNDVFMSLADSFGYPKGAKNPPALIAWLKLCGSKEGQDAFNPLKGSIPCRSDADIDKYNDYSKSAYKDFQSNKIVGSLVHGVVANEGFSNSFSTVMGTYLQNKNAEQAASACADIAAKNGITKQ